MGEAKNASFQASLVRYLIMTGSSMEMDSEMETKSLNVEPSTEMYGSVQNVWRGTLIAKAN